ncbi:hypothetical protein ACHAWF_017176 [Thalassiosira exigua]
MASSAKPSVSMEKTPTNCPDEPSEQRASVTGSPEKKVVEADRTDIHRKDWADANNQVDYFVSAGYSNDSIYNTALTPGGTYVSFSPIRRSRSGNGHPGLAGKPIVGHRAYPSQELRSEPQQPSPPTSDGDLKPPPLPPPPVFQAYGVATGGSESSPDKVGSSQGMVLPYDEAAHGSVGALHAHYYKYKMCRANGDSGTGLTQELTNLSTSDDGHLDGSPDAKVLDSFDIDSVGEDRAATGNAESNEFYSIHENPPPIRVSTSPSPKAKRTGRTPQSRKKTKGRPKKAAEGIMHPKPLDILRGRGGLTNRHEGNRRFRDEARKLRANYRDKDTSRQDKFVLSQVLAKRVKEYGGRFLERGHDGLWYEMSERDARKKASQVLREEKWE